MATFLEGLRVLDLTQGIAGALATMLLRDGGAEVLLVERPGGIALRHDVAHHHWLRGKRSTIVDLSRPEGSDAVRRLARDADVMVQDWRPAVAQRLGLDYSTLQAENPALVSCAITGFGVRGPLADLQGYEPIVMAKAGMLWDAAQVSDRPGPTFLRSHLPGYAAGHAAAQGIMAALHHRGRTGRGQEVRTNLAQAMTPYDLYEWIHASLDIDATIPGRLGVLGMMAACTADGCWVQFANAQRGQLQACLDVLGLGEEFDTLPDDPGAIDAFGQQMRARVASFTLDELMQAMMANPEVGIEAYRGPAEVLDHPQLEASGHVVSSEHPRLGHLRQLGSIAVFDGDRDEAQLTRPAPEAGEHAPQFAGSGPRPFCASQAQAKTKPATRGPLEGVTVLELGWYYAAPFGATLLADLGARVIKVESLAGDPHRWQWQPPEYCGIKVLQGKESIALDIARPEGRTVLSRLVAHCDVVLRNFRQSSAERLGVDFAGLVADNAQIANVYAGAYGATGPYSARPAYAPSMSSGAGVHALNLSLDRLLEFDSDPLGGRGAQEAERLAAAGFPRGIGDSAAAIGVATGLLTALLAAERTGRPQNVQTSMLGTSASLLADAIMVHDGPRPTPRPDPGLLGPSALSRLYRAAEDEWIVLVVSREEEWRRLCGLLRASGEAGAAVAVDVRFKSATARTEADAALASALGDVFLSDTAGSWEARARQADVACVEVSRTPFPRFCITDPVMVENGAVAMGEYPGFGEFRRHGATVSFSATPTVAANAPTVGQHTRQILAELGYSEVEMESMRDESLVGWPDA